MNDPLLTTRAAATLLGVSTSTVKRWAEQGLLACEHTAGGHRRYRRSAIRALVAASGRGATVAGASASRRLAEPSPDGDVSERGLQRLLESGDAGALVDLLHGWRAALGAWWRVADRVGVVLSDLGRAWAAGAISVLDEHLATERLRRALARCAEGIPVDRPGPGALLATAPGDDHELGLLLCELVLREAGWAALWAGRRSPVDALAARVRAGGIAAVALSASSHATDASVLAGATGTLADACAVAGATLVLGGAGAWPDPAPPGVARFYTFADFAAWLRAGARPGA